MSVRMFNLETDFHDVCFEGWCIFHFGVHQFRVSVTRDVKGYV